MHTDLSILVLYRAPHGEPHGAGSYSIVNQISACVLYSFSAISEKMQLSDRR